ncbi:HTTM domain-containing protein [Roseivirga echinicomitans]
MLNFLSKIIQKQFDPVDNSPLVLFRMIFGFLIFAETFGAILTGWVKYALIDPKFTFTLIGLEWLQPLPGYGMYAYFAIMAICGLCVMVGYRYRLSLSIFTTLWTLVYWMQKSHYNNHYYLLILLCLFMLCVPAHAYASYDAKRWNSVVSMTCPRWCINIFIIQLWIVFTFAAINKFYPGWLEGHFIQAALGSKKHYWLIGDLLQKEWLHQIIIYGGIAFDLLIVYFLLWKKTRGFGFIASILFNLFNAVVFQIGIFPFMMIGLTVLFFNPETIRKAFFPKKTLIGLANNTQEKLKAGRLALAVGFAIYFGFQIYLPLRHHLYKGDVFWTEEGHRLSWRMMLRLKYGDLDFEIKNSKTGQNWLVNPLDFFTDKQVAAAATKPDMIWQMSRWMEKHYKKAGIENIEIYANTSVSLNGSTRQPIIDPDVDLTKVKWQPFKHSVWILSPK